MHTTHSCSTFSSSSPHKNSRIPDRFQMQRRLECGMEPGLETSDLVLRRLPVCTHQTGCTRTALSQTLLPTPCCHACLYACRLLLPIEQLITHPFSCFGWRDSMCGLPVLHYALQTFFFLPTCCDSCTIPYLLMGQDWNRHAILLPL